MKYEKLSNYYKIKSGGTPSRKNSEFYFEGQIPWAKTGDLKNMYLENVNEFITEKGLEQSSAKLFPKGTVLLAMYGATIGNSSILSIDAATNQACAAFLPNEHILSEYLYYFFLSIKSKLISKGVGGAQPNISISILKDIEIPYCSIEKQKEIVNLLNLSRSLIEKRKNQITELSSLAQSLFFKMFGDPNTNSMKWDIKNLGDIVNNENSKRVPIKEADRKKISGIYPYYGATGIVDYINDFKFEGEYLLISEDGKALESRNKPIAFLASGKLWVNNHAHILSYNGHCELQYLQTYIESISIKNYITGIDQYKLNRSNLVKIPVMCPPIELQRQFSDMVKCIEKQISTLKGAQKEFEKKFNSILQISFK